MISLLNIFKHSNPVSDRLVGELGAKLVYNCVENERPASHSRTPQNLSTRLALWVRMQYPQGLYSHQSKCIESLLSGQHTAICTSTASGKSVGFTYPVINDLLKEKEMTAIFVYPIKALANDQIRRIQQLVSQMGLNKEIVQKFDGDIHGEERKKALEKGRILVVTPDVLHTTLLRENGKDLYMWFFKNLKYVVLDECHVYSGAFGSNMAYVVRRLRQICSRVGSDPVFAMASATVGNPTTHLSTLTGFNEINVISEEDNGSPSYGKEYFMLDYEGSTETVVNKIIKRLLKEKTRFIIFCHTRKEVEILFSQLNRRIPEAEELIKPYRAGYESSDRLGIEKSFRDGRLMGVISTSALELGIDLPNLDVCIMLGLPSTRCSMVQRAGRVGRSSKGKVYIIKTNTAFDNYYFNNPKELFEKPLEPLILNLDNQPLIISHYACSRAESGNFENPGLDQRIFGNEFIRMSNKIRNFDFPDEILYTSQPHFDLQIRNISDPTYKIVVGYDPTTPAIGTLTYSQVLREAYTDAVYLHMGKRFRVNKISFSKKAVFVDGRCPYTFTKPKAEISVRERHRSSSGVIRKWGQTLKIKQTSFGIIEKVTGYSETSGTKRDENVYRQPLMRHFVTDGVLISLTGMKNITHGAVVGIATALENSYPLCYPCAREDVSSYAWSKGSEEGHIYLFDNSAGGLAITWPAVDYFEKLIETTFQAVVNCSSCVSNPDQNGCINCVDANRWYTFNVHSDRKAVIKLLKEIKLNMKNSAAESERYQSFEKIISLNSEEQKYGKAMISTGSLVFTGRNQEGFVVSSQPYNGSADEERIYEISVSGQTFKYIGSSLTLLQGNLEKWCINCGQDSIDYSEENCPICGMQL